MTLEGARRYAQGRVGPAPELGTSYAVSADGVGKVEAEGCKVAALFPLLVPTSADPPPGGGMDEAAWEAAMDRQEAAAEAGGGRSRHTPRDDWDAINLDELPF